MYEQIYSVLQSGIESPELQEIAAMSSWKNHLFINRSLIVDLFQVFIILRTKLILLGTIKIKIRMLIMLTCVREI